jgi:hypothetical protein
MNREGPASSPIPTMAEKGRGVKKIEETLMGLKDIEEEEEMRAARSCIFMYAKTDMNLTTY